jgi:hypothetical protein
VVYRIDLGIAFWDSGWSLLFIGQEKRFGAFSLLDDIQHRIGSLLAMILLIQRLGRLCFLVIAKD